MRKNRILIILIICALCSGCGLPQPANKPGAISETGFDLLSDSPEEMLDFPEQNDISEDRIMSYAEFLAADMDQPVTIESYLQEKLAWSDGSADLFLQDEEGAYYVYHLACTLDEYEALNIGQKLRISGYKTLFSGELQLTDACFRTVNGFFIAEPADVTEIFESDELYRYLNRRVLFRGLTIEPMFDGTSPFYYGWDNSGSMDNGSDLYFTASCSGMESSFVVKEQLRGTDSETYRTVQSLRVGDTVDLQGILFWYNGSQPFVTSISVIS